MYRGNRRGMAGMAFMAFIAFSVAFSTRPGEPFATRASAIGIGSTVLVLSLVVIAWMLTIRLQLTRDGLDYHSMFGRREFLWSEVERVFFEVNSYSIHGLPLGTRRVVTFVTRDGKRFSVGNSVARTAEMMNEAAQLTLRPLYERMWPSFNTGKVLDLGAVRLSRMNGLEMKGLFGFDSIGLDEIGRYALESGELRVWKKGALLAKSVRSMSVANLYPLLALLDSLYRAPAPMDDGGPAGTRSSFAFTVPTE